MPNVTVPGGAVTHFGRDSFGRMSAVTGANGTAVAQTRPVQNH